MKRISFMIIVFVFFIYILSACSNKSTPVETLVNKESQTDYSVNQTEAPTAEVSLSNTVEEVKNYFSSIINLGDYEDSYNNNSISLTLKSDLEKPYYFTTDIVLDGKNISLPCEYNDLVNAGWKFAYDFGNQTIEETGGVDHLDGVVANNDGKEIWVTMTNHTANSLSITQCTCTGISFATATKDQDKNEKAPNFDISTIHNNTTLKEIVDTLGNPSELLYIEEDNMIQVIYNKNDGSNEHLYISYYWCGSDEENIMRDIDFFISESQL